MRKVLCLMLIAIMLLSVGCSAAVSVVGANINDDGNLILSMSDGSTIDAGYAKGDKGDQGDIGPQGPQGIQGPQGEVGPQGPKGERGPQGEKGDTGAAGRDGVDGKDGTDGKDGASGAAGQTPYIGENGNWWIGDEDTGVKAQTTDFIFNDNGNGTILLAYVGSDYNVKIPAKTTEIGVGAFKDNRILTTVEIPNGVTTIRESSFENCSSLQSVVLPEGLSALGKSAFMSCSSLENAYIPYSLITSEEWEQYTFAHCSSLEAITWGTATDANKTGDIPSYTFYECSTLDVDSLPNYIDNVFNYAFAYTGIRGKLELTSSIREYAFSYCDKITDITLTMYDGDLRTGAFLGCYNLKKVEFIIPDVVQGGTYSNSSFSFAIWEKAFEGCQNLETVIFPETTTVVYEGKNYNVRWYISSRAFSTTGFSEFTLPANIGWIEAGILDWCDNLKSVYIEATTPPFIVSDGIKLFETCSNLESIYVPAASVDAYKAADGWKNYADKIRAMS